MKTTEKKPMTGKLVTFLILAIIVGGTVSLNAVADVDKAGGFMTTLFIGFLGAIIAVQLTPALMLFGMLLKGLANMFSKEVAVKDVK